MKQVLHRVKSQWGLKVTLYNILDAVPLNPTLTPTSTLDQYLGQLRTAEGRLRSMNTAQAGDLVENLG